MKNTILSIACAAFMAMATTVSAGDLLVSMTKEEYQSFLNLKQMSKDALALVEAYEDLSKRMAAKQEANEILMSELKKYKDMLPVEEWKKLKEDKAIVAKEKARLKAWDLKLDKKLKNAISKEHKARAYAKKIENYVEYEVTRLERERLVRVQKKILVETLKNLRDLTK